MGSNILTNHRLRRTIMAQTQMRLVQDDASQARHGKHKLDELDPARIARHLVMFEPTEAEVTSLMTKARREIPGLADTSEVLRVLRYNPICMMALARKSKF